MPQPPTLLRRGRLLRTAVALAALLAVVGYLVVHLMNGGSGPPRCTVRADGPDGDTYSIQPEQAANAATISAVGSSRGLPERAITIALATAMQESGLRNISHGDRDSLGLFQQRPSQGWGNTQQILDPVYSSGKFYDHLVKVPGYSRLPLTVAAQRVQRSGFPQAYAKHEPDAALLSTALMGRKAAALSCTTGSTEGAPGDPAKVRAKLVRDFGPDVLPQTESAGQGQRQGQGQGKLSVPVQAPTTAPEDGADPKRRGWELAHWAVAHAAELRIERISYAGREWSADDSGAGWGEGGTGESPAANEVRIVTVQ